VATYFPGLVLAPMTKAPGIHIARIRPDGTTRAKDEGADGLDIGGPLLALPGMTTAADAPGQAVAAAPSLGHHHHHTLHREKSLEREREELAGRKSE
jgi:hypothetical protein